MLTGLLSFEDGFLESMLTLLTQIWVSGTFAIGAMLVVHYILQGDLSPRLTSCTC